MSVTVQGKSRRQKSIPLSPPVLLSKLHEILNESMPEGCRYALWMELHSVVRPVPVRKSHQYPSRWQLRPIAAAEQRVRQLSC